MAELSTIDESSMSISTCRAVKISPVCAESSECTFPIMPSERIASWNRLASRLLVLDGGGGGGGGGAARSERRLEAYVGH